MRGIDFSFGEGVAFERRSADEPSQCLTPALSCRTLSAAVIDSFSVTWPDCTGPVTGPLDRMEQSMLSLSVSRNASQPLCDQIVAGIKRQIDDRHLRPGTRLPSIRSFAETHSVSRFTVVEAYDRLVAMGYLQSRRGSGFYAAAPTQGEAGLPAASD